MAFSDHLCFGMAFVYSFFGVTLAISPYTFWGPESPLCYWTVMDESGVFFGKALGIVMTCMTMAPYVAGVDKKAMSKVYLPMNAYYLYLFYLCSFVNKNTGPGKNALFPGLNMWWTQLPIAVLFLVLNVLAVFEGPKAKAA